MLPLAIHLVIKRQKNIFGTETNGESVFGHMHQSWFQLLVESVYVLVQITEALTRVFRLKVEQECSHKKQHWTCVKINPFKYFGISNVTICDKKPALSKFMLIQKKRKKRNNQGISNWWSEFLRIRN